MADTILVLGDFQFAGLEIPDCIPFGGEQLIARHQLVGGARQLDALGPADAPLQWSGVFQELSGMPRARHLDYLRRQGAPQTLTWDAFRYNVLIKSFVCDFRRYWFAPYRIACEVIEDLTNPIEYVVQPPIEQSIMNDMNALNGQSDALSSLGLPSDLLSSVQGAIGSLNTVTQAAAVFGFVNPKALAKVQKALYGAQGVTSGAVAVMNGNVSGITSAGAVVAGVTGNKNAQQLLQQTNSFIALSNLTGMSNNLNRMGQNVALVQGN